jgi:hypothetical protein
MFGLASWLRAFSTELAENLFADAVALDPIIAGIEHVANLRQFG